MLHVLGIIASCRKADFLQSGMAPLGDMPLINRAILTALGCDTFNKICVTSDSPEVCNLATSKGIFVLPRKSQKKESSAMLLCRIICHEINRGKEDYQPDVVVWINWRSPFSTSEDFDGMVLSLAQQHADVAIAGVRNFGQLVAKVDEKFRPVPKDKLPDVYCDARFGRAVYAGSFMSYVPGRYEDELTVYEVPQSRVLEIKTEEDYEMARRLAG